jgi:hypothetical protein
MAESSQGGDYGDDGGRVTINGYLVTYRSWR